MHFPIYIACHPDTGETRIGAREVDKLMDLCGGGILEQVYGSQLRHRVVARFGNKWRICTPTEAKDADEVRNGSWSR